VVLARYEHFLQALTPRQSFTVFIKFAILSSPSSPPHIHPTVKVKKAFQTDTNSTHKQQIAIANEGPVRIKYKCLVPIYVFPEMKLCGLVISKTVL
jgi:hypothetical protein